MSKIEAASNLNLFEVDLVHLILPRKFFLLGTNTELLKKTCPSKGEFVKKFPSFNSFH